MTLNLENVLLVAVFASQIIVLSFYVPLRWRRYYVLMFTRYPPEQYSRLYPVPKQDIERRLSIFRRTHLPIGVVAAVIFVVTLIHAPSSKVFAAFMSVTLVLQFAIPFCIAMPLGFRIWKAFRAMPPPSARSAELRPWRITDFVSPLWIGLGLSMQALGLACTVIGYLYWPKALGPGAVMLMVIPVALLVTMIYPLFAPRGFSRPDPYMSATDTFSDRQRRYRARFRSAAAVGPIQALVVLAAAPFIHIEYGYTSIVTSVCLQLCTLWFVSSQLQELETRDFSVYRADSGTHLAPYAIRHE
ncbi:MAG TPA: hypothetical protein VK696_07270 [Steroidobacteraceae bacterium]|jgi:hypothetical protein|nr:hypothetical protein [Steroidobacteraceae bacterium]